MLQDYQLSGRLMCGSDAGQASHRSLVKPPASPSMKTDLNVCLQSSVRSLFHKVLNTRLLFNLLFFSFSCISGKFFDPEKMELCKNDLGMSPLPRT